MTVGRDAPMFRPRKASAEGAQKQASKGGTLERPGRECSL